MDAVFLTAIGLGFLLGVKHALDADHVVAVSTIVSRYKSIMQSSLVGVAWGLGHTSTLFLAGLGVIVLKIAIPNKLALGMEFTVGIMLVALGILAIRAWHRARHSHPHLHDSKEHVHSHRHEKEGAHVHSHGLARPYVIGMVHGLAGSGALTLLVLGKIEAPLAGVAYILVFGLGSVLGMMLVTTVISMSIMTMVGKFARIGQSLGAIAGMVSIALGVLVMYEIGIVQGLLL